LTHFFNVVKILLLGRESLDKSKSQKISKVFGLKGLALIEATLLERTRILESEVLKHYGKHAINYFLVASPEQRKRFLNEYHSLCLLGKNFGLPIELVNLIFEFSLPYLFSPLKPDIIEEKTIEATEPTSSMRSTL
jgi:hypothetical protein